MQIESFMTIYNCALLIATILNGLLAGVFFTWTNSITPGIGKLSDIDYLQAFQEMNKSILNPLFYLVFFGPILFSPIAAIIQYYENINTNFWILIAVCIIYGLGIIVITFLGNIPLNNRLDKLNLNKINLEDAKQFRASYEKQWNRLHFFRTLCSSTSFILLLIIFFLSSQS